MMDIQLLNAVLRISVIWSVILANYIVGALEDAENSEYSDNDSSVDQILVTGLEKKSIELKCPLPTSDPPRVRWLDYVHNSDPNPSLIFDSWNNTEWLAADSHSNRLSYEVTSNFTLIINNLRIDSDPGTYFCESRLNESSSLTQYYYVTVGSVPECKATQIEDLRVGSEVTLSCSANYSGNQPPRLTWHRDEVLMTSDDLFEIRQAKQSLQVKISAEDDDLPFVCAMKFGDIHEQCDDIRLQVRYPVIDVIFLTRNRTQFYVGELITCKARGNPVPQVSIEPGKNSGHAKELRYASQSVEVDRSWKDKNITLVCTATNSVDGHSFQTSISINISVFEQATSTIVPSKPVSSLSRSKIDSNPGIVGGAIVVVALVLLSIIGAVVLVRKHRDKQRQKAAAAQAETNRLREEQMKKGRPA